MSKGRAIVVSGPSGSGKDTILRVLLERHPEIRFSISCVTRPKRGNADEDAKYRFLTVDQFRSMIDSDAFLEYNNYVGNYYGTPKQPVIDAVEKGDTILIEVDVNGAYQIKKNLNTVETVFIMPPSMEELERRLRKRSTDDEQMIQKRIAQAGREIACAKDYDYIVVNDSIEKAVDDLSNIIFK